MTKPQRFRVWLVDDREQNRKTFKETHAAEFEIKTFDNPIRSSPLRFGSLLRRVPWPAPSCAHYALVRQGVQWRLCMERYTIDPADFTDSQWTELYYATTIVPRSYESHTDAKPFKRDKKLPFI